MKAKLRWSLLLLLLAAACGKDDPKPPAAAVLIFPEPDSECTTGISVNDLSSEVEFLWNASENTLNYDLEVVNLANGVSETRRTTSPSAVVALQKGAPYSWQVTSINNVGNTESEVRRFYNAGSQANYAPFPATAVAPGPGASVAPDADGMLRLEWDAGDVDGDLEGFEVYLETADPPETLAGETDANTRTLSVAVSPGNVYYWSIISTDAQGNLSQSGVYSFKVL